MSSIGSIQPTTQPTQQIPSAPNSGFVLASTAAIPLPGAGGLVTREAINQAINGAAGYAQAIRNALATGGGFVAGAFKGLAVDLALQAIFPQRLGNGDHFLAGHRVAVQLAADFPDQIEAVKSPDGMVTGLVNRLTGQEVMRNSPAGLNFSVPLPMNGPSPLPPALRGNLNLSPAPAPSAPAAQAPVNNFPVDYDPAKYPDIALPNPILGKPLEFEGDTEDWTPSAGWSTTRGNVIDDIVNRNAPPPPPPPEPPPERPQPMAPPPGWEPRPDVPFDARAIGWQDPTAAAPEQGEPTRTAPSTPVEPGSPPDLQREARERARREFEELRKGIPLWSTDFDDRLRERADEMFTSGDAQGAMELMKMLPSRVVAGGATRPAYIQPTDSSADRNVIMNAPAVPLAQEILNLSQEQLRRLPESIKAAVRERLSSEQSPVTTQALMQLAMATGNWDVGRRIDPQIAELLRNTYDAARSVGMDESSAMRLIRDEHADEPPTAESLARLMARLMINPVSGMVGAAGLPFFVPPGSEKKLIVLEFPIKDFNDGDSHETGDDLIAAAARIIQEAVGGAPIIHDKGTTFIIPVDPGDAESVLEQIKEKFANTLMSHSAWNQENYDRIVENQRNGIEPDGSISAYDNYVFNLPIVSAISETISNPDDVEAAYFRAREGVDVNKKQGRLEGWYPDRGDTILRVYNSETDGSEVYNINERRITVLGQDLAPGHIPRNILNSALRDEFGRLEEAMRHLTPSQQEVVKEALLKLGNTAGTGVYNTAAHIRAPEGAEGWLHIIGDGSQIQRYNNEIGWPGTDAIMNAMHGAAEVTALLHPSVRIRKMGGDEIEFIGPADDARAAAETYRGILLQSTFEGTHEGRSYTVYGPQVQFGELPIDPDSPDGRAPASALELLMQEDKVRLRERGQGVPNIIWHDLQDVNESDQSLLDSDIIMGSKSLDDIIGGGDLFPAEVSWLDANRANLLAGTSLAGHAGQLFDMLDQRGLGNLLFAGSKIGAAAFNPNASSIVGGLIGLAGRFGGEDVQKIAGHAAFAKSVGSAILNPGPEAIGAVLEGALGRLGVDPAISGGIGLGGQALQMALFGGGPLAAVGLAIGFAQYLDARVGQPNVIRLSTQLDGQKARVEYGISAQEYRTFLDAEGREPRSFNGGIFEMDGKYYLGGSFGYDQFNQITSNGEGGMPGAILGLPGGFIQKRGDGAMMESLEISEELYNQLLALNGGDSGLQAAAGDPIFELVAPRMGLVEEVRYTTTADEGMPSDLMPGVTIFVHPELGEHRSGRDHIGALFSNPLMAGHHHFRDADQAAMFGAFGLMAGMMVAGNPELARSFGGFDAQRMLDHFAANAETMMESPMFDVYGYLAANPDVAQAVGPNLMDAIRHYLDAGIHEGRSTQATEEAKLGAMARVTGLALYDEATYLALNPDVAEAVARGEFPDGRAHYEAFGFGEGRMAFFDEAAYLAANPDVAEAIAANGGTALEHFVQFGRAEGRPLAPPAPVAPEGYDEALYLQQNPDVAAAVEAGQIASGLEHFHLFGEAEGRSPGIVPEAPTLPEGFDAAVYMNQNPDVLEAGKASGKPLDEYAIEHYLAFGKAEGRWQGAAATAEAATAAAPSLPEGFDAAIYMNQNPDILEAGIESGRPLDEFAIEHYLAFGKDEGRAYA